MASIWLAWRFYVDSGARSLCICAATQLLLPWPKYAGTGTTSLHFMPVFFLRDVPASGIECILACDPIFVRLPRGSGCKWCSHAIAAVWTRARDGAQTPRPRELCLLVSGFLLQPADQGGALIRPASDRGNGGRPHPLFPSSFYKLSVARSLCFPLSLVDFGFYCRAHTVHGSANDMERPQA